MNQRLMNLVGLAVAAAMLPAILGGCAASKEKENEVTLTLEQTPAAVQATLTKAVGSGKIQSIEKETKNGKTSYEADAVIDGKEYEINIAEDGTLLGKQVENERSEGKEEKGDKD